MKACWNKCRHRGILQTHSAIHLFGQSTLILQSTDAGLQLKDGKVEIIHFLMEENLWESFICKP